MTDCITCGNRDYLCQRCKLEELESRHGVPEDHFDSGSDVHQEDVDDLEYECTECGHEYTGSTPCPECGAYRRRYIGPLAGEEPELATDGGETVCGKRSCDRADTVSFGSAQVKVRCERHALEAVDGIGPTSADRLFDEFETLESICYAARYRRSQIATLQGFSPDSASTLEGRLESAGVWIDPDTGTATDGGEREAELVNRAVREAVALIEKGDSRAVALEYVLTEYEIEHRHDDVHDRLRDHHDRTMRADGGCRKETIVGVDDGIAIGEDAVPASETNGTDADGMRCHECGHVHDDWMKDGQHTVDDGHNAGIIERYECGICGAITEGGRR